MSHRLSSRGREAVVRCGVCDQEARPGSPVPSADGAREPRSRREEEVDARASSTTSNAEIGHDPHRPEGLRRRFAACVPAPEASSRTPAIAGNGHLSLPLPGCRRHGPVFFVAAPRRWKDFTVVAAPRTRTHGARNGRRWGPVPSLEGAERVRVVRRAPRWEQTPQIAADFRPQQNVGEICGLIPVPEPRPQLGQRRIELPAEVDRPILLGHTPWVVVISDALDRPADAPE